MPRTIISLTQEDKEWLAQRARAEHVPVTELVRRAILLYRQRSPEVGAPSVRLAPAGKLDRDQVTASPVSQTG